MVLAPTYLKQRDTAMAALTLLKSELTIVPTYPEYRRMALGFRLPDFLQRKLRPHDVAKVIDWSKSAAKTPYMKLLTADISGNVTYDLYDLLGSTYLREHNYNAAINTFKNIPRSKLKLVPHDWGTEMHSNPFLDRLHDFPKKYDSVAARGYTKLRFAKRMAKLRKLVRADPKNAARYYYIMATGLYSTSFYSNAWYYISYTNTSYDRDRKPEEYYDADFLNTSNAQIYFLKARALSNNKEFKARCTFMAAKCHQKQTNDFANGGTGMRHDPYFRELQKHYSKTAFYQVAIEECSYFRDFIRGSKK
jgi:hypothetical protein